jgi:hypothetical protein
LNTRVFAALLLCVVPLCVSATDLPDPRGLIDRYMKTVGGDKAAETTANTGTVKMTMEIVENGMKGRVSMYLRPDAIRMTMSMAGTEFQMGMSDHVSWAIDPMHGPRLLEGEELQNQIENMSPGRQTYDMSLIESLKTSALSDSESRPCYRVDIVWKSGSQSMSCFSTEDGLLLATESTSVDPSGEGRQLLHMYDYKRLGGVLQPSKIRMKTNGVNIAMTIDSFDEAAPPDDVFALPPAIVTLLSQNGTSNANAAGEKPEAVAPEKR